MKQRFRRVWPLMGMMALMFVTTPAGASSEGKAADGATLAQANTKATPATTPEETFEGATLAEGEKVNLNAATATELEMVPGIGPVLARDIVAWREAHGLFAETQDLMKVPGIRQKRYARFALYVVAGDESGPGIVKPPTPKRN